MQRKAEKSWKWVMHKTNDEESQETNLKTRKERHAMESFTLLTQSLFLMSWPWLCNV